MVCKMMDFLLEIAFTTGKVCAFIWYIINIYPYRYRCANVKMSSSPRAGFPKLKKLTHAVSEGRGKCNC